MGGCLKIALRALAVKAIPGPSSLWLELSRGPYNPVTTRGVWCEHSQGGGQRGPWRPVGVALGPSLSLSEPVLHSKTGQSPAIVPSSGLRHLSGCCKMKQGGVKLCPRLSRFALRITFSACHAREDPPGASWCSERWPRHIIVCPP